MMAKIHHFLFRLGVFEPLNAAYLDSLRRSALRDAQFLKLEAPAYLRRSTKVQCTNRSPR